MTALNLGELKHRVELQAYTELPYQGHVVTKDWSTIATVWAKVETVSGLTTIDTKQINQGITHKITIRYFPNLSSEYWILFKSRRLRIRTVSNLLEENQWLVLLCEQDEYATRAFEMQDPMGSPLSQPIDLTDVVYLGLSLLDIPASDLLQLSDAFLFIRE